MPYDLVLTEDDDRADRLIAHRPGCPVVQLHRAQDRPIVTMIGVSIPIPADLKQHSCLEE